MSDHAELKLSCKGTKRPVPAAARLDRRRLLRGALGLAPAAAFAGPGRIRSAPAAPLPAAIDPADTVVVQWDEAALQAIRDTKPGPPMVARAVAFLHTCMYDAWAAYDPIAVATASGSDLKQPEAARTAANKRQAVSFAAYRALADLFPTDVPSFVRLMTQLGYSPADTSLTPDTPQGVGNLCARAVIDFRHADGSNQTADQHAGAYSDYTGYQPVNTPDSISDPDRWQPLRVPNGQGGFTIQRYIGPHWGLVTPFALTSGAQFRPAVGPATFGTDAYVQQAVQILDYSANLTDRQKVIAEYWADGPLSELPPGHWCLFGQFVSRRDAHDLDADIKLFFALANAVLDAGIAAWDGKRAWDSVRPVTAIHYLYAGKSVQAWGGPYQGTRTIRGEDWQPYQAANVVTPPFPEYFSGHSTFSAAGAEILKRFTGSDAFGASTTQPAGSSRFESGQVPAADVTLSWETFSDAADEAGISRRYGGIHFEQADLDARRIGRLVGAQVWDRAQAYINGSLSSM